MYAGLPSVRLSSACKPTLVAVILALLVAASVETRRAVKESSRSSRLSEKCPFQFAEEDFSSFVGASVEGLSLEHRPLLVHTRIDKDSLVFLREGGENYTIPLHIPLYYNLQAISHLPVSVVATVAPDVASQRDDDSPQPLSPSTVTSLNDTLAVLRRARELVTNENFPEPLQMIRQMSIITTTTEFITARLLSGSDTLSLTVLEEFGASLRDILRENANDAVCDYLQSLNTTITELLSNGNITDREFKDLSVLVNLPSFTEPHSFIVQYYERLLDYQFQVGTTDPERIILSPSTTGDKVSLHHLTNTSINTLSRTTLTHIVARTFYGESDVFSSTHLFLSKAAEDLICSPDLMFQSCPSSTQGDMERLPAGFSNRTERAYVAVIVFTATLCIVLAIVLLFFFREGDIMRKERKELTDEDTGTSGNAGTINAPNTSTSDEEEDAMGEGQRNSQHSHDGLSEQKQTSRGRFYQVRSSHRFRGRPSVKGGTSGRERPSVTYSEVSIVPSAV